jgi:dihydroneopterin aldolase
MSESDRIFIRGQRVSCHIGVPDEERASPQELLINTTVLPCSSPDAGSLDDDINKTIDYHTMFIRIGEVAKDHPRKLVETLAEDLAGMVIAEFPVSSVTIEIEKFVLPGTQCVGVAITREARR